MDDRVLSYYNRELAYLRRMGAEFAEQHPKIAANLRLDRDEVDDPHVLRLIESFAFLTSRIRCTIDDSFPELTEALISLLYPNFHAPYPSQSVVQLSLPKKLSHASVIPAGTLFNTDCSGLPRCLYRTRHETTVLPVNIPHAAFHGLPLRILPPITEHRFRHTKPQSSLEVMIQPNSEKGLNTLAEDVRQSPVKFYINAQTHVSYLLYEFFMDRLIGIGVMAADTENTSETHVEEPILFLGPEHVKSCVFDHERAAQNVTSPEYDGRTSAAHDRLRDYFGFPQQFLFFEIDGLSSVWDKCPSGFTLLFYFSDFRPELAQSVNQDTLLLGCVPIINLFRSRALTNNFVSLDREIRIEVDPHLHAVGDVHQVCEVTLTNAQGDCITVPPYFGGRFHINENGLYWVLRRENTAFNHGGHGQGTNAYLALVSEADEALDISENWKIEIDVLCTNRDIPSRLPFGPSEPALSFYDKAGEGIQVKCLTAPTPTRQPRLGNVTGWQLISLLTLQSFSGPDGLETLKRALSLYNPVETISSINLIEGIIQLTTAPTSARITRQGHSSFCHGTRISLMVDQQHFVGNGVYVLGEVLNEFFGQFCAMNSFTQLEIRTVQQPESPYRWPAQSGTAALV